MNLGLSQLSLDLKRRLVVLMLRAGTEVMSDLASLALDDGGRVDVDGCHCDSSRLKWREL
jgi:hypothetical protein